jgi:hypothetical protein
VPTLKLRCFYILEGGVEGMEDNVDRTKKWDIELKELPVNLSGLMRPRRLWNVLGSRTPPLPWVSGVFKGLKKNLKIVQAMRATRTEVIGKLVKRTQRRRVHAV